MSTLQNPSSLSREEQKKASRIGLKKASLVCFQKNGVSNTQIKDIASQAGVARATFYFHFNDKQLLIKELIYDYNTELNKMISNQLSKVTKSPSSIILESLVQIFLNFLKKNPPYMLIYSEQITLDQKNMYLRDGINPELVKILIHFFQTNGNCSQKEAHLLTHGILALWMRVGLQYIHGNNINKTQAISALTKMTIGVINAYIPNLKKLWRSNEQF
jgi:AcrR family transcriptional regulator